MFNDARSILKATVVFGGLLWLVAFVISLGEWSTSRQIDLLILLGINLLAPLSLRLITQLNRAGNLPLLHQIVITWQPVVAVCATISLLLSIGTLAGVLAGAWLVQSALLSLIGLMRWLPRLMTSPLPEFCIDVGYMYTGVSGVWFIAYRASGEFFGFTQPLVPLTAAHFTFISLGALVVAGMIGRQLHGDGYERVIYRIAAWGAIISPGLVALGITLTEFMDDVSFVEIIGVIMLASSYVVLAVVFLIRVRPTIMHTTARRVLIVSVTTLFVTMALALAYSIGRFTGWWDLTIANMVATHGWLNAAGFAGLGVLGWSMMTPKREDEHHVR